MGVRKLDGGSKDKGLVAQRGWGIYLHNTRVARTTADSSHENIQKKRSLRPKKRIAVVSHNILIKVKLPLIS